MRIWVSQTMTDELSADSKTQLKLKQQEQQLNLQSHEKICEIRYNELIQRIAKVEKWMWTQITMMLSGFGAILYHLIFLDV